MMKNIHSAFVKSCLLLLLIIVIVSCSEKEIQQSKTLKEINVESQLPLNIVGHWMGEGKRELIVTDYTRTFGFLNQDVNVNLVFPEEIGYNRYNTTETQDFVTKILLQETPDWDIIVINDAFEGTRDRLNDPDWAKKYLVDFSSYPEITSNTIDEIDLTKVKERWGGIIPGPFLEGNYWALYSNKNVADKIGIEIKQTGMTFNDFMSYIKALNEYNKRQSDNITFFEESADWGTFFSIALQLYLSEVNNLQLVKDGQASEIKLQAWHKTLLALEQLSAYSPLNSDHNTITWTEMNSYLLDEKCLFFANGSWMYNIWNEKDKGKVMNCIPNEFPTFDNASPLYPGGYPIMWAVLKKAKNKEKAIKFLLDMNSPYMAETWVRNTKCPTGIKGNVADVSFGTDKYEDFSFHVQNTYGTNLYTYNVDAFFIFGTDYLHTPNYFMEVLEGEITADEAMLKIREIVIPINN